MNNRIFLMRVSYLVPVCAESAEAALDYMERHGEAIVESLDQSMDRDDLVVVHRELTADAMEGLDGEDWGSAIPWDEDGSANTIAERLQAAAEPENTFLEAAAEA